MRYTFIPPYFFSAEAADSIELMGFFDDLHSYAPLKGQQEKVVGGQDIDLMKRDVVFDEGLGKYLLNIAAGKQFMLFLRSKR